MPVMGGEEALFNIRNGKNIKKSLVPVIALTAHALKGDRERFLELGFNGYLAKPVVASDLVEQLERCLINTKC